MNYSRWYRSFVFEIIWLFWIFVLREVFCSLYFLYSLFFAQLICFVDLSAWYFPISWGFVHKLSEIWGRKGSIPFRSLMFRKMLFENSLNARKLSLGSLKVRKFSHEQKKFSRFSQFVKTLPVQRNFFSIFKNPLNFQLKFSQFIEFISRFFLMCENSLNFQLKLFSSKIGKVQNQFLTSNKSQICTFKTQSGSI